LWLFAEIEIEDEDLMMKQVVEAQLKDVKGGPSSIPLLSKDFSHKTLTRKAGMKVVWTSNLLEHLQYDGESTVHIFRHAQALGSYGDEGRW
jgi:ethanolamine utilization protein EutQ (cupin superfamily)